MKNAFGFKLNVIQKICLTGLMIALTAILQKVTAVNYIAFIPFLRLSFGGTAAIIFSSLMLGPWLGLFVGASSDILGYLIFDPKSTGFLPQITLIYTVLGFVSYFVFFLIKKVKNTNLMILIEGATFASVIAAVSIYLFTNDTLNLYSSTYSLALWQKFLVIGFMTLLFAGLFVITILLNKNLSKKQTNVFLPIQISFGCFIIDFLIMVVFGTIMKGWAFGFQTYPMILLCQLIVMFVNVPVNTVLLATLFRIVRKYMV